MFLKIVIIFLFIFIFFNLRNFLNLNRKQKVLKTKKFKNFNKKNLDNWMNLTKKERYKLSKQDSFKYMDRRKLLLDEIRKEYKKISKEILNNIKSLIMEKFWTSNMPILGLRHFVLVNETKEKGNIFFLMVSVVDSEINIEITYEELINSGNWQKGWINLPKLQSITEEYGNNKSSNKVQGIDEIFVNEDSLFNIS